MEPRENRGASEAVREALKAGPRNRGELALLTGLPRPSVDSVICRLIGQTGGVIRVGNGKATKYALYVAPEPAPEKTAANIAVPRRPEPVQPIRVDMMAHMRLNAR